MCRDRRARRALAREGRLPDHTAQIHASVGFDDRARPAWWFDGWKDASWKDGIPPPEAPTVAPAETWLLRVGWMRSTYGLLAITEIPPAGRR
jgi:hypothetical protein